VSHQLIDPDPGNHATFTANQVRTIGAPYYRTEIGAHENSASPYGTFDQGGNVQEFNETVPEPDIRSIRGGSWQWSALLMRASEFDDVMHSSDQFNDLGFRVASLVEPTPPSPVPALSPRGLLGTLVGVSLGGAIGLRARRRSRSARAASRRPGDRSPC
jgi:hypothetical protein